MKTEYISNTINGNSKNRRNNRQRICRFFGTEMGCANGDSCTFVHAAKTEILETTNKNENGSILSESIQNKTEKSPLQRGQKKQPRKSNVTQVNSTPEQQTQPPNSEATVANESQSQPLPAVSQQVEFRVKSRSPMTQVSTNRAPVSRPTPKLSENLTPIQLELRSIERRFRASFTIVSNTPIIITTPSTSPPSSTSSTNITASPHQYQQIKQHLPPTIIQFDMPPTDPDFPFDLEALKLRLIIPSRSFLPDEIPHISTILSGTRIKVLNPEIPANLARVVENGWRRKIDALLSNNTIHTIATRNGNHSNSRETLIAGQVLLGMTNWLDRQLEILLSGLANDLDTVGVVGFVTNNSRSPEELRQSVIERVNAGFHGVNLAGVVDADRFVKRHVFYYGVPVGEDEDEDDEGSESCGTGSDFHETESTASIHEGQLLVTEEKKQEETVTEPLSSLFIDSEHCGTQIKLIDHSIKGISLLECITPKFLLSCIRCKSNFDFSVAATETQQQQQQQPRSCPTCSIPLSCVYRPSIVHANSQTVGYLDLDACSVVDMLPSAWRVTCSVCDKPTAGIGVLKSLPRGNTEMKVGCCSCHARMEIMINEIKFIRLIPNIAAQAAVASKMALKPQKKKRGTPDEGIVYGQPLPQNGACNHYRKSYRWFRFPCCGKVFPCDLCHEANKSDGHDMQWATRMVCGYCSREQVYSQQASCLCGRELTRRFKGGFWEGGNGTRSRTLMSKKDTRKKKGLGKKGSQKSTRVGQK
ncbi:hypothetical protein HK100_009655 [Physocladia obscura]|uniref:Uncharacterized protein n=1 Tax=Physocladia obscura TaxID=109957 RepID=A0AAD5T5U7_9FUNG|nr:hypothetical protein HK100_009655 [Physocladia obscura]